MLYAVVCYDKEPVRVVYDDGFSHSEYIEDCQVNFEIKGLFRSKEKAEQFLEQFECYRGVHKVVEIESDL